uniref:C-type lectin domain-containing protein n=1 Tax=Pelodiscus sinensis TaxID=13735 RepID=K7F388_PELSI
QCPLWHRIALGVGWAGNVILAGAVIVLSIWVRVIPSKYSANKMCSATLFLEPPPLAGSECKLCPMDWLLHREKCYWVSKEIKCWKKSFEDCTEKKSHMLVIHNQEEMDFIQTITKGTNHVWIGLNVTSPVRTWIWVDGSPLHQTLINLVTGLFQVCSTLLHNSGNKISSETCGAEFRWVCQKE